MVGVGRGRGRCGWGAVEARWVTRSGRCWGRCGGRGYGTEVRADVGVARASQWGDAVGVGCGLVCRATRGFYACRRQAAFAGQVTFLEPC